MKTKIFLTAVLSVLFSTVITSCSSDDNDVFDYTIEQKGRMAHFSCSVEETVGKPGTGYYMTLFVFNIVEGDRLTGDYYYVNNGETEEIRMKMLYGEELVLFPANSIKTIWNAKAEFSTKISEKKPMPEGYCIKLTGSTSANITIETSHGIMSHLGVAFETWEAYRMDRGTFGDI